MVDEATTMSRTPDPTARRSEGSVPAAADRAHAAPRLAAFRYRNYQLYWVGQLAANVGTWMQMVAVGWLVLELTDSAAYLGFNAAVQGVPIVVFAFAGGVIADRFDRYRLMVVAQVGQLVLEVALAVLVASGAINVAQIFAYSFLHATISGLTTPARQAFVPRLVPREALPSAVAMNSSLWQGGAVLGPTVAGLVLALWGLAWPFYLNVVGALVNLGALLLIRVRADAPRGAAPSAWDSLIQGAHYVVRHADVRTVLLGTAALCLLGRPYTQFMPAFARDVFGVGPEGLGLMLTMPSIGAVAAVVAIGVLGNVEPARWFLWCGVIAAVALVAFAASPSYGLSLALLVVLGAATSAALALAQTALLYLVDDEMRGRVMGYFMASTWGGWRLGSLPTGLLAEVMGTPWAVVVGALVLLVAQVPVARSHLVRAGAAGRRLAGGSG
jgi:MFS family permease